MTATSTNSNSITLGVSGKKRPVRGRFALLVRGARHRKEVSQLHEEAEFYCGSAIELHALLVDQSTFLEQLATATSHPTLKAVVGGFMSRHNQLIKQLLNFWPPDLESQQRVVALLVSDGLARVTESTPEGYLSLSTGRILKSVELAIEATKGRAPRTSSSYEMKTASVPRGTGGNAPAIT